MSRKRRGGSQKRASRQEKRSKKRVVPEYVGTAHMSREGFIFVKVEGQEDDIYVKASKTRGALHGDTVRVAVTQEGKGRDKRRSGEVIDIIERSNKPFVGILHIVGKQAWVLMSSKTMPYDISVPVPEGAERGMKVAAVVDGWERGGGPYGHVVDVLGLPGENETEMHAILAEFGLPYRFSPEVENAADKIPDEITDKDRSGRKDFRKTLTFTIDPTDAKDFDDALSFKKLEDGNYEVGVHIADVTYYVQPGTPVDKQGKVLDQWFGRTHIISDYRFDYEKAQSIIEGAKPEDVPEDIQEAILVLNKLALKFRDRRFKNGAVNFERPEMKVDIDDKGRPIGVHQKLSAEANWLIEEFMLLANRTVAEWVGKAKRTFVYRVHDEPNMEKLAGLRDFAGHFGYKMGALDGGRDIAHALNGLMADAKDKPELGAIQILALRSMAKACYSVDNIGHYGLAFPYYTHFTSPIRRYPDMMVHRLLSQYLRKGPNADSMYYAQQCKHASEREVVAAEAERESIKYKLVEFMQDKIGQEFDGHVSGVTEWGVYVEIEPTKIEGMIPYRTIKCDFFIFDQDHYRAVGKRTRKSIRLGDPLRIRVKGTSLEQKILDYELIEEDFLSPAAGK